MLPNLRNLLSLAAGLAAFALLACPIAPASAGQYDVWSCRGPAGQPLSTDAWNLATSDATAADVTATDDCATGGPFELSLTDGGTGNRRAQIALEFDLPRGAVITDYRMNRAVRAAAYFSGGPIYTYIAATRERTAGSIEDWGCASSLAIPYFNCSFDGSPTDPDDPTNQWSRTGLALDGLAAWVGCTGANGCQPPFSPPAGFYYLWGSRVTIADNSAPNVVGIGGSLAAGDPLTGKADLFIRAEDGISGVSSMNLEIDGIPAQSLDIDTATCAEPYEVPRPCPADAGRIFTIDTSTLGAGTHTASGIVTDAAGNQTAFAPVSFVVKDPDPGPPAPENGTPAVASPLVKLDTGGIWQKPGSAAVINGRLTTQAGLPVAGAVLRIRMTQLGLADPAETDRPDVTTGSDGRFSIPVPGSGARQVGISFTPYADGPVTSKASITVRSRLGLRLRRKPARIRIGRKVRFSGRLTGAGPSAAGVPVEIQAKVAGKWQSVATVRSRSGGKWNWVYRFRYVKRNAIFSFRAIVRAAPGWPWPLIKSPVRKVRIKVTRR